MEDNVKIRNKNFKNLLSCSLRSLEYAENGYFTLLPRQQINEQETVLIAVISGLTCKRGERLNFAFVFSVSKRP